MSPLPRFGNSARIDVLVVCTGNVCRSPYAAAVLQSRRPALAIASAGTAALTGQPLAPEIVDELAARGIPIESRNARQLSRRMVRDARLVVTATRAHRVAVVALDAGAAERTFTLKELARLLASSGSTGFCASVAMAVVRAANALRAELLAEPHRDYADDLADPFGLDRRAYESMTAEVDAALAVIGPALDDGPAR